MNLENIMPSERSQSLGMVYQHDSIRMKGPEKTFMETENRRLLRDDWWGSWRWWLKDGKFLWGTWEMFSKSSWWWMRFLQRCWTSWWAARCGDCISTKLFKTKRGKANRSVKALAPACAGIHSIVFMRWPLREVPCSGDPAGSQTVTTPR